MTIVNSVVAVDRNLKGGKREVVELHTDDQGKVHRVTRRIEGEGPVDLVASKTALEARLADVEADRSDDRALAAAERKAIAKFRTLDTATFFGFNARQNKAWRAANMPGDDD